MKVLCVSGVNKDEPSYGDGRPARKCDEIYEGEIYTVVGRIIVEEYVCYFLEERRKDAAYNSLCFIPISDKNEELIELSEHQKIKE